MYNSVLEVIKDCINQENMSLPEAITFTLAQVYSTGMVTEEIGLLFEAIYQEFLKDINPNKNVVRLEK